MSLVLIKKRFDVVIMRIFFCCNPVQVYVEGPNTHAVQTAWAMLALIYAGQVWFLSQISLNYNNMLPY